MSSSTSSRRRRRPSLQSPAEQQVVAAGDELVSRLRALLPAREAATNGKAKASRPRVLREACVYIRRLHAELDAAAETLARLLDDDPSAAAAAVDDGTDEDAADVELIIRNLLV